MKILTITFSSFKALMIRPGRTHFIISKWKTSYFFVLSLLNFLRNIISSISTKQLKNSFRLHYFRLCYPVVYLEISCETSLRCFFIMFLCWIFWTFVKLFHLSLVLLLMHMQTIFIFNSRSSQVCPKANDIPVIMVDSSCQTEAKIPHSPQHMATIRRLSLASVYEVSTKASGLWIWRRWMELMCRQWWLLAWVSAFAAALEADKVAFSFPASVLFLSIPDRSVCSSNFE